MKVKGYFENTEEVEATLEITMTLKEWKEVAEALPEKYPHWQLSNKIKEVIWEMKKVQVEDITN